MEHDDDEIRDDAEDGGGTSYPSPWPAQIIDATVVSLSAATDKLPEGQPLTTALGIALPSGMACLVLPENVDQTKLREQVERLSTYDEVIGFSYVAVAPTHERKLAPGEAFADAVRVGGTSLTGLLDHGDTTQTGHRLIIAAITRQNGRLVRVFDTSEAPGSEEVDGVINREVNPTPTIESPIFLSPIFEGIWEVAQ